MLIGNAYKRFIVGAGIFDNDESLWINSISTGMGLHELTREYFLSVVNYTVLSTDDDYTLTLASGIKVKLERMTDKEWLDASKYLPFYVTVDGAATEASEPWNEGP